jgi:acyl-CoA thioesterase-1
MITPRAARRVLTLVGLCLTFLVAPAAQAQCRIEAFGDSLTAGVIPPYYNSNGGYRAWLVAQPPAGMTLAMVGTRYDYSPAWMGYQAWHSGFPGARTDELLQNNVPADFSYPNVILLHAGTNDIHQGRSGYDTANQLLALAGGLSNRWPGAKIIVAKIIPFNYPATVPNAAAINAALNYEVSVLNYYVDFIVQALQSAGRKAEVVDMYTGFPVSTLWGDGIHPNDSGYQWMANVWRQKLSAVGCY